MFQAQDRFAFSPASVRLLSGQSYEKQMAQFLPIVFAQCHCPRAVVTLRSQQLTILRSWAFHSLWIRMRLSYPENTPSLPQLA